MRLKHFLFAIGLSVAVLLGSSNLAGNAWSLLTARGYIIPDESSIWSFRATVMNDGSGEWWQYGEDDRYFYHFWGAADRPYQKIGRDVALNCSGFKRDDVTTWCKQ